ncbi:MAG: zf-HC2 domain-containing protein [Candidatus Coatesbacteria bacterium]|nr:zf-HC2 domain-containing protein [Candidatus Coatesbacteria bacterium]
MKSKACKKHLIEISAYLDGELSPTKQRKLVSHLEDCPGCAAYLDELRSVSGLVSSVPSFEPSQEVIFELRARLQLEMNGERARECDAMAIRLSAYIDNELSAFDRELVESHLVTCQKCSQYLEELRLISERVSSEPRLEPHPAVISALKARLRSPKAGRASVKAPIFTLPRFAQARFALSAAAVAVVFFGVLLSIYSPFESNMDLAKSKLDGQAVVESSSRSILVDLSNSDLKTARTKMLAELASADYEELNNNSDGRSGGSLEVFDPSQSDTKGRIVHSVNFADYPTKRTPVSSHVLFVSYGK